LGRAEGGWGEFRPPVIAILKNWGGFFWRTVFFRASTLARHRCLTKN